MNTPSYIHKPLAFKLSVELTSVQVLDPYILPKRAHHVLNRAAEMTLPSFFVTKDAVWRFIQVNSRPIATPFPQGLMTPLVEKAVFTYFGKDCHTGALSWGSTKQW